MRMRPVVLQNVPDNEADDAQGGSLCKFAEAEWGVLQSNPNGTGLFSHNSALLVAYLEQPNRTTRALPCAKTASGRMYPHTSTAPSVAGIYYSVLISSQFTLLPSLRIAIVSRLLPYPILVSPEGPVSSVGNVPDRPAKSTPKWTASPQRRAARAEPWPGVPEPPGEIR